MSLLIITCSYLIISCIGIYFSYYTVPTSNSCTKYVGKYMTAHSVAIQNPGHGGINDLQRSFDSQATWVIDVNFFII